MATGASRSFSPLKQRQHALSEHSISFVYLRLGDPSELWSEALNVSLLALDGLLRQE